MKEIRPKKCAVCPEEFIPNKSTQRVCSMTCAIAYGKSKVQKQNQKAWKKEKKIIKEKLKTHKDWLKDFEEVFNSFIRLRDKNQPCISCGAPAGTYTMSAGHHYPAGSFGNVRFDEINVNGQCWWNCNKNQHGNFPNYEKGLIERFGKEEVDRLKERAYQSTLKISIPEIKEKIDYYRQKIKEMKRDTVIG